MTKSDDDTEQSSSFDETEDRDTTYTSTILPLSSVHEVRTDMTSEVQNHARASTLSGPSNDPSPLSEEQKNVSKHDQEGSTTEIQIDDGKVNKAIIFLKHPSIAALPHQEKITFLHSKGVSDDEIKIAELSVGTQQNNANSSNNIQPQDRNTLVNDYSTSVSPGNNQRHGNPNDNHYETMISDSCDELPSPMVPITLGGFIAIFGLATWRWLNGGDFVMLPPSSSLSSSVSHILPKSNHLKNLSTPMEHQSQPSSTSTSNHEISPEGSENNGINHIESGTLDDNDQGNMKWVVDEERTYENSKEVEFMQQLTGELQCLTAAIEKNTSVQERKIKMKSEEKSKVLTDKSMDLLRQKNDVESSTESPSSKDPIVWSKLEELSVSLKQLEEKILDKDSSTRNNKDIDDDLSFDSSPSNKENMDDTLFASKDLNLPSTRKEFKEGSTCNETESFQVGSKALSKALQDYSQSNDMEKVKSCSQILFLYMNNLSLNPTEPRYRKIFTNNKTFKEKVGGIVGAKEILLSVGFVDNGSYLEWSENELCTDHVQSLINDHDDNNTELNKVNGAILLLKEATAALGCLKVDGTNRLLHQGNTPQQQEQQPSVKQLYNESNGKVGGFLKPPTFLPKGPIESNEKNNIKDASEENTDMDDSDDREPK